MTTFLVLAALAVLPNEDLRVEREESAAKVLERSEAAYAAVKSYVGTTTVRSKSDFGAFAFEQISAAKVSFQRPGKLHIEGTTASRAPAGREGRPFTIISDGDRTWRSWAILNNGAYQEVKNVPMAGMGGVAQGAAEGIPAALMKSDGAWVGGHDPFIVPRLVKADLADNEKIDGAECYKVVAKHPKLGDATLWIDAKMFLLRQMQRDYSEAQMAEQNKTMDEELKKMGKARPEGAAAIKTRSTVTHFTIDQVDGAVSATLFADPTK
jgi:hypothetical protein